MVEVLVWLVVEEVVVASGVCVCVGGGGSVWMGGGWVRVCGRRLGLVVVRMCDVI